MNLIVSCPHCQKQVSFGDNFVGTSIRCCYCQGEFVAPPPPPPIVANSKAEPVTTETGFDFLNDVSRSAPPTKKRINQRSPNAPFFTFCKNHPVVTVFGVLMLFGMLRLVVSPIPPVITEEPTEKKVQIEVLNYGCKGNEWNKASGSAKWKYLDERIAPTERSFSDVPTASMAQIKEATDEYFRDEKHRDEDVYTVMRQMRQEIDNILATRALQEAADNYRKSH